MGSLEKTRLTVGFIPLNDSAPLIVARERGHFERHGLDVALSKETSWANVRDKLAIGVLDAAHMLAPMVVASHLGLGPVDRPAVTALSLGLNGNAVTVSEALYRQLAAVTPHGEPVSADSLREVVAARRRAGDPPLTFATVFPHSMHNYLLRYWLAAGGIDPDREVRMVVVPPPQMVEQLRRGTMDGYCVGEPWNAVAVKAGLGRIVITGYDIWNNSPEKVLGVNQEWAEQYPNTHQALLRATLEAMAWMEEPANRLEVVDIISRSTYVNAPREVVRMSMTGTLQHAYNEFPRSCPDFHVFNRYAASFPWRSHALWMSVQMLRWGQIAQAPDLRATVARAYLPAVYREAAAAVGLAAPAVDHKLEGAHGGPWVPDAGGGTSLGPDRFLDGAVFDPGDPVAALLDADAERMSADPGALRAANPAWGPAEREQWLAGAATSRAVVS